MAFTAQDVKTLREITGCGMMDCKKALTETNGDQEKAIELLREKGLAAAAKKAGRIAAEGIVKAYVDTAKKVGVVIEVNAETDFVAKNADFQAFVDTCAQTVVEQNPADVDALLACKACGSEMTIADLTTEKIQTIGENIKIRRFTRYEGDVATYIHAGGKIGVLVTFNVEGIDPASDAFQKCGRDIAMQVAALNPVSATREDVPADVAAHEMEIYKAQAAESGKPEAIQEKIALGRMDKFYKENCLAEQDFVKNPDLTVAQYADECAKEMGGKIAITGFVRFALGE